VLLRGLWEVRGELHKVAFLLGRLAGSLLIIVYPRKTLVVGERSIEVLKERVFLYCFGVVGGRLGGGVNQLVYKIGNRFPRSGVLSDSLNG